MIINAFTYLTIQASSSSFYYLLLSFISTLQTLSLIIEPQNDVFEVLLWLDPSNYLKINLLVINGLSLLIIFLIVLFLRLLVSQKNQELVHPSTFIRYIGTFLLHLQTLCKSVLFVPFLRASMLVIQNSTDLVMLALSTFSLVLYLVLLLPLLIYNSSNTFILTPQLNRKLNYWNTYVLTSVFRVVFVFGNVLNNSAMPFICCFYFFVYFCLTLKRPVFAYTFERTKKAMVSAVGYITLVRVFNSVLGTNSSVLVQVLGILGYIALIQFITNVRIKQILGRAEPSIYQFKLLFFMVGDLQRHMETLQHFILTHHQKCNSPVCRCSEVVRHLSSKDSDLAADKIWYEFLESFVKAHYSLQDISRLPESQLQARLNKYQYLVVDLVEIQLFKLGKLNEAYYILSNFAALIERKKMQSLVFEQKRAVMKFYLQQAIRKKYKVDGVTNQYADKFMNFQIEFENYRKLLLKAASKTAELWEEMNKRDPDQKSIIKELKNLQKWNAQIKEFYKIIALNFQNANQVLEQITKDYFQMVLNISSNSSFHVIQVPKFQQLSKKKTLKYQRLSENMQSFALDSQTPICFVSVQKQDFAYIKNFNSFFNELMKLQYGNVSSIKSLIIPEMRDLHHKKMQQFIKGDYFTRQHKDSFTVSSEGKLIYTKLLIQIMPTIKNGLQYVVYFRKVLPNKKIICIKNQSQLVYSSKSFCDSIEVKFTTLPLIKYITTQIQQQIRSQGKAQLNLEEGEFELNFLYAFVEKQMKYLFLQIVDRNMFDIALLSHVKQDTYNKPTGFEIGDYIQNVHQLEQQSQFKLQQVKEQNDDYYKSIQSEKKKTTTLKQTFEIILNKSQRKFVTSTNIFIKLAGFIRIALLIAVILIKLGNQKDYLTAMQINSNYHNFMLLLSRNALNFKLINLYTYQNILPNTTNNLLKQIQSQQPLGPAMDNFLYQFDIPTLSQTWIAFAVSKNSTYSSSFQNNFLSFSDNILNPITNLNLSNTSSFNFPFVLQLNTKSLSSTASFFFQFITNTIYTFLPNFRTLKTKIMDPILYKQLNNYSIIIGLNVGILLVTGIWIIWIVYKHRRIVLLKHLAYKFLQSLKRDLVTQKENRCLHFLQKYQTYTKTENQSLTKSNQSEKKSKLSNNFLFSLDNQNQELSFEQTKNIDPIIQTSLKETQNSIRKFSIENQKKEGQCIFKSDNFFYTLIKYLLPCFPLIIYTVIQSSYEVSYNKNYKTMLYIQQNLQNMQQDILNLRLYSLQYASHSEYLQKYMSFSTTLQSLISQLFKFEKIILNTNKFNNLPLITRFTKIIYYGDLCQLEQQGQFSFSNFIFEGKGNLTYCRSLSNQILTKGAISSLLSYIQSANTVFYGNSKINTYNMTQKLSFLNDNFFTDIARLTDYFNLILDTGLYSFQKDYKQYVSTSALIIVSINGFFIIWLLIIIFLFRRYYLSIIKWDILEIHSIFTLISYETVLRDKELKEFLLQNVSQFKIMK